MKISHERLAEKLATAMTEAMTSEQLVNYFFSDQMEYFMGECDDHELMRLARHYRILSPGQALEFEDK